MATADQPDPEPEPASDPDRLPDDAVLAQDAASATGRVLAGAAVIAAPQLGVPASAAAAESAAAVDPATAWILFGSALVGLLVAAFGATTAAALLTYSPTRLARLRGGAEFRDLVESTHLELQLLARMLTVLGLTAAVLCTWVGARPAVWPPMVVMTLLATLFCGVFPARLAEICAEPILGSALPVLRPLRAVLRLPLLVPLNALTSGTLRLFRLDDRSSGGDSEMVADEILTAVSDSAHDAELPDEERHWIENIVELKSMHASEVMTPRPDVVGLHRDLPIADAIAKALETGHSRYPVFGDSPDDVVGLFYAKDALQLLVETPAAGAAEPVVGELAREKSAVPETMPLDELLRHFRTTKRQLAIVQDEYGGTSGIVTLEDVLEEIVGDIEDEHDPEAEVWIHVLREDHEVEASGRARIDEVNEHLGDRVPEDDHYDTVGGWVFTRMGRVPIEDEQVELDGLKVQIIQADERRVIRMRITVSPSQQVATGPGGGAS